MEQYQHVSTINSSIPSPSVALSGAPEIGVRGSKTPLPRGRCNTSPHRDRDAAADPPRSPGAADSHRPRRANESPGTGWSGWGQQRPCDDMYQK